MALEAQIKSVPLYGGIDSKTDPKFVSPGKLITCQNVNFPGVDSVVKRYGQTALPASGATSGKALGAFGNELLTYDGTTLRAYAQAQQTWVQRATLTETQVSVTPVVRSSGSVNGIASLALSNAEVYAWEDTRGGVYYAVRDPLSGTFLVPNSAVHSQGVSPHLLQFNGYIYLVYGTSSGFIFAAQIDPNNLASGISSTSTLSSDYTGQDFAVTASTTKLYMVWQSTVANTFNIGSFNTALAISAASTFVFAPPNGFHLTLVMTTDYSNMICLYAGSNQIYQVCIDPTSLASALTGPTAAVGASHYVGIATSATAIQSYYDSATAASMPAITSQVITFTTTTTFTLGGTNSLYGLNVASQPVLLNSRPYLVGVSPLVNRAGATSQQASYYLVAGSTPIILQRFSGDVAYIGGTSVPQLCTVNGTLFAGLAQRTQLRADANGTVYSQSGLSAVYFTFPTTSSLQMVPFGSTCLLNCGSVYSYDGSFVVESGFWEFPDGISAVAAGSGGSLNAGSYYYAVTYEWTDAAGNAHYSAPSYPIHVTTVASDSVTLTVPYTALTRKTGTAGEVQVVIYRTATSPGNLAGTDTGLGPWYKVTSVSNAPGLTGTASFTYVDTATDASISGNQLLYAPPDGSGELDNWAPPPFLCMVATKTRMWGVAQDDLTALWYSKPLAPGRPAEWSEAQILRIETVGGLPTALGALDTQCVLFKTNRMYYVPGDGPNAAGQPANAFPSTPILISSTAGCTVQPSVISTHEGLFFKSATGIQRLNRSLSTDFDIGLDVQGFNSLSLTGAQIVAGQNQLRWVSSNGTALVFDYLVKRWGTYSNYDSVGYVLWNGTTARLRSTGQVLYEDPTVYTDNLQPIQIIIETAWIKLADLAQGYAAAWYAMILGEYLAAHQLTIEVAYDYLPIPSQTSTWDATNNVAVSPYGSVSPYGAETFYGANSPLFTAIYQPRVALQRQVCEAIKFKIYDVAQTGASCKLNQIAIQLGIIGGINRVPTNQQV